MAVDIEQRLFALFKHLFGEWVAEQNYDTEQMQRANAGTFIAWCRKNWNAMVRDNWERVMAFLNVETDAESKQLYETGHGMLFTDFAIWQVVFTWWPMLSLAGRQPLKRQPMFIHLSLTIGYPDGKGVQIVVPTQNQGEQHFKHDGYLCSLLRTQTTQIIESLMANGLDAMYDKFAQPMTAGATAAPGHEAAAQRVKQGPTIWTPKDSN